MTRGRPGMTHSLERMTYSVERMSHGGERMARSRERMTRCPAKTVFLAKKRGLAKKTDNRLLITIIFMKGFDEAIALQSESIIMGQPCGSQLEYRVKAINTGGESPPSNTVAVVL